MVERESLQIGELAERQGAAAAGVNHAGAGGGHAAGKLVAVLGRGVVGFCGGDVVVGPVGGDMGNGFVDGCPGFEARFFKGIGIGGVGGWGE